jgi:glutamyl-tRNA synthetase|tara:strand:+ start:3278 stop:4648 length:1371 start_codon:yes stop_codon:yes gene_type:complete
LDSLEIQAIEIQTVKEIIMKTTRFAPSPTGYIHVGNLRTALFNYLIARKNGGEFILRLDDTDPVRSTDEYADAIKEDLAWLGLHWDRVEKQSDRIDQYNDSAEKLRKSGRLYECFETPVELDLKRKKQLNMGKPPVYDRSALLLSDAEIQSLRLNREGHWRFKLDLERINWKDGILGDLSIDAASVSDPVLIRGDGQFLYTMASVCDDIDFGITSVVRGSDHVTNTATQIQIIEALNGNVPSFAHHSLLTGPKGEPLSKRLGTLSLRDLRANGLEPMAILSYMSRLGSSEPIELFDNLSDLTENFNISNFGAQPTKFDLNDISPISKKYISGLDVSVVSEFLLNSGIPADKIPDFWLMVRDNINTQAEVKNWWSICFEGVTPLIDKEDLEFISIAKSLLPVGTFDENTWKIWTSEIKEVTGRKGKALFMPLRKALTGVEHGPDMSKLLPLLQKINI